MKCAVRSSFLFFFLPISCLIMATGLWAADRAANVAPPRFVFAAEFSTGKVAGFNVNPTNGELTPTGQAPVWAHWGPVQVVSDKGGFRLYVANQGSQDLSVYFINRSNGYLTPVPGSPFAMGGTGTNVAIAPSGKFVYATTDSSHGGSDGVSGFEAQSDGSLTPVPGSPFYAETGPDSIVVDPSGRYVYVGHEISATDGYNIDAFSIDGNTGSLTPVAGEPYTVPTPSQCFFCFGGGIGDLKTDVTGHYLFAPVFEDGTIGIYEINGTDGSLTAAADSPFIISLPDSPTFPGAQPSSIAVDAVNRFVYTDDLSNDGGGDISRNVIDGWALDASTGALSYAGSFFIPQGTCDQSSLRADPSGKFLYSTADSGCEQYAGPADGPGVILGMGKKNKAGQLSLLPGSPFPLAGDPILSVDAIAVTP